MQFPDIDWSLYAILDQTYLKQRSLPELADDVIQGGAGIIQLRDKSGNAGAFYENAVSVKRITEKYSIPLIINDRVDIAMLINAAGVHLGQDDLPFEAARKMLGKDKIIGASVHSLTELAVAEQGNADYLGVGTIYASQTKSALKHRGLAVLEAVRYTSQRPIVAIGGITTENLAPVIKAGADGVAVISDLMNANDIKQRAQVFIDQIKIARHL